MVVINNPDESVLKILGIFQDKAKNKVKQIQKNATKTKTFSVHDAWQVGSGEPFPKEFEHFLSEGRLQKTSNGYVVLNFTQAQAGVDLESLPQAKKGDWLAAACAPHNRLFIVEQENFLKHYHEVK